MNYTQRSSGQETASSILRIDNETYAELISEDENNYIFNIRFKLYLLTRNEIRVISDYDRVEITVKRKESNETASTTQFSNFTSANSLKKVNPVQTSTSFGAYGPNNNNNNKGSLISKLTPKVSDRLYAGLKILKDAEIKESFIAKESKQVNSGNDSTNTLFRVTELFQPTHKEADIKYKSTGIDPAAIIERINRDVCSITTPVQDKALHFINGSNINNYPELASADPGIKKPSLYYDMINYYIKDIQKSPSEDSMTWYLRREVYKNLDSIELMQEIKINKGNRNSILSVKFDLFKLGLIAPEETLVIDLLLSKHVEAWRYISTPPRAVIHDNGGSHRYKLSTDYEDASDGKRAVSFNIYRKTIDQLGNATPYTLLGNIANAGGLTDFNFNTISNLSIIRVIPVDSQSKEANIFTDVVVGPGHDVIGKIAILPYHLGGNTIKVEIHNVPSSANSLWLMRRDCVADDKFSLVSLQTFTSKPSPVLTIADNSVIMGRAYEYQVIATSSSPPYQQSLSRIANIKSVISDDIVKDISVNITNQTIKNINNNKIISFKLETIVSESENERITNFLKAQLGEELYKQFLDPSNNISSPIDHSLDGITKYKNLFLHEVIRTNLNTGDRETFELISDGVFEDKQETRSIKSIKPINPLFEYKYQVLTYKKNPIEIFKNFVAYGKTDDGKEWFYRPYKWKNPKIRLGALYDEDESGMPIIPEYENLTAESYGLTATYAVNGSAQYTELNEVLTDRIDPNTIKISWGFDSSNSNLYDSFVVMKVVNGNRSLIGVTQKNYIYHELDGKVDLGTIYYIVVPIMAEFDIGKSSYSNSVYVSPELLTERHAVDITNNNRLNSRINNINIESNNIASQQQRGYTNSS